MESLSNLLLIHLLKNRFYIIVMFWLFRCRRIHWLLIRWFPTIHDISHIKCIMMCKPVIQYKKLLSICFSFWIFNSLQCIFSCLDDFFIVILYAFFITILKCENRSSQIIIADRSISDIIYRLSGKCQHFPENSQFIIFAVIKVQEEWCLYSK